MKQGIRHSCSWLLPVIVILGVASYQPSEARSSRVNQIPNGTTLGCAACHANPAGGGARNDFGKMVESDFLTAFDYTGGVVWGADLAALDADGDGVSNGAELGDPDGTWKPGDEQPNPDLATYPGDAASTPVSMTAVAAATWAEVKAFFGSDE